MKLSTTKEKVRELLEQDAIFRNHDKELMVAIWSMEIPNNQWEEFPVFFTDGTLTPPESIRRCRQKLQEENPSLRGTLYGKRQKHQEDVKGELREPIWGNLGQPGDEMAEDIDNRELKGQTELFDPIF